MSIHRSLADLARELSFLSDVVEGQAERPEPDIEALLDRYAEMRRNTADAMQRLTAAWLAREVWRLDLVIERVESELRSRFSEEIPLEHISVRGYRGKRLILFEYLAEHMGSPVSLARLRAFTGDQVHTERRLRELRDLGLQLRAVNSAEDHHYILESENPDFDHAASALAKKIVDSVPQWTAARRQQTLERLINGRG